MSIIHTRKHDEVLDTPLLLFACTLADGSVERWCSHRVTAGGHEFEPRLLAHGDFHLGIANEEALDSGSRFYVDLSNVDGRIAQIDRNDGWNGAKLQVSFGFFDVEGGTARSELKVVYLGVANPVENLTDSTARISFVNRLSMLRVSLPGMRVQSRCQWRFPSNEAERLEAVDGGARGRYSPMFGCGYSADAAWGVGNLGEGGAFATCARTRAECEARGMFLKDGRSGETLRFSGFQTLPPSVMVRGFGEKASRLSDPVDGRARSNDTVPLLYGTGWLTAPVIFARNDGNLTHCEVLIGEGPIEGVLRVVANGVALPPGSGGADLTGTGWYNVLSLGGRNGSVNADFVDSNGAAAGDPHGGMACLSVVVPNRLLGSGGLPRVEVMADGLKVPSYSLDGSAQPEFFSRNPAWVVLDLLRRVGWRDEELNLVSFARTAAFCDENVDATASDGTQISTPRFELNLALQQRKSVAEILRGIRAACSVFLTIDEDGRLMLSPETTIERQQPAKVEASNATAPISGGWPAYEFGDGTEGTTGILRLSSGKSSFRQWRRGSGEIPNRLTAEYQDSFREYTQDTISLVDYEDSARRGVETSAPSAALGLPNFDQAVRVLRLQLQRSIAGNQFVEFETSVQAFGLRPGDLIAVTHARTGLSRGLFRVLRLTPALNFERARIVAQAHEDRWYALAGADMAADRGIWDEASDTVGIPRPLAGRIRLADGSEEFEVSEQTRMASDGTATVALTAGFNPPPRRGASACAPPLIGMTPEISQTGGGLSGGTSYYYGVSAVDGGGQEGSLSYLVRAVLPGGVVSGLVKLVGLRAPAQAAGLRVYRGKTPLGLRRVAEIPASSESWTDAGVVETLAAPVDNNYDHARFQWRMELLPLTTATEFGESVIGSAGVALAPDAFLGCVLRIQRGHGAGQERSIVGHTANVFTVNRPWSIEPDATSEFTIAEPGWVSAGVTNSSELTFLAPNRPHEVIQILGVPVNALGVEGAIEDASVTRHLLLAESSAVDRDVPGAASFAITDGQRGEFEFGGIGFETLENTRSVLSGTFRVHYWNEMNSPTAASLAAVWPASDTLLVVNERFGAAVGDLLQVGRELVRVLTVEEDGLRMEVERGVFDTNPAAAGVGDPVYLLSRYVAVIPFPDGLFGSAAGSGFLYRVALPGARIAAAEFYVTNVFGDGPSTAQSYTGTQDAGVRTMIGGQYTIQYEGILAVTDSIAPPLIVDGTRPVRDVRATVSQAPLGAPVRVSVRVDGQSYAELVIPAGSRWSNSVSGFGKRPLAEGSEVTVAVTSVGTAGGTDPGQGLTVTMRL